jgi:rod shape-determining protein MreC
MKDIFNSKGFKVLITCVVILVALLIYTQQVNQSFFTDIINFISAPMQSVSSSVTSGVKDAVEEVADTEDSLRAEIARLEEENRLYREQLVDYAECKNLIEHYESVLELKEKNQDFMMVSGEVIGRDPNDLSYGFSIDVGSSNGVYEGAPVITGDGLVGWVSQVYATTSIVTTIFSPDTQIGATCVERSEKGVLQCDIVLSDQKSVQLSFLDADTTIQPGDIITTTGLGGQFPKGLLIGEVLSVERSESDVSKYALVAPFVDIQNITQIFVLTDFTGKGQVEETAESESSAQSETASENQTSSLPNEEKNTESSVSSEVSQP